MDIGHDFRARLKGVEHQDSRIEKKTQRIDEKDSVRLLDDVSEYRHLESNVTEYDLSYASPLEEYESDDASDDTDDEDDVMSDNEIRYIDQYLSKPWELDSGFHEGFRDLREDEGYHECDHDECDDDKYGRVDHRSLDAGLQLYLIQEFLIELGEDFRKSSRLFSYFDQGDDQGVEISRVLLQCIGNGQSIIQIDPDILDAFLQFRVFDLFREDSEGRFDVDSAVEEISEPIDESPDLFWVDSSDDDGLPLFLRFDRSLLSGFDRLLRFMKQLDERR